MFSRYYHSTNVGGLLIPQIPGYKATSFSFWVYNVDAEITYVNGGSKPKITTPGWNYINQNLGAKTKITEFIFSCQKPGTVYIDAVTVQYEVDDDYHVLLDGCDYPNGTRFIRYTKVDGAGGYNAYSSEDLVKFGTGSIGGILANGKQYWFWTNNTTVGKEYDYLYLPTKEGKTLTSVSMWVYNAVAATDASDNMQVYFGKNAENRDGVSIPLDFTGWKKIVIPVTNPQWKRLDLILFNNKTGVNRHVAFDYIMAEFEDNFKLGASTLSNNDGALDLSDIQAGDILKHTVTAKKLDSAVYEYKMYIATFDGDGRLTGAAIDEAYFASTDTGDLSADVKLTVAENQEVAEVRGYVWTNGQAPVQTIIK